MKIHFIAAVIAIASITSCKDKDIVSKDTGISLLYKRNIDWISAIHQPQGSGVLIVESNKSANIDFVDENTGRNVFNAKREFYPVRTWYEYNQKDNSIIGSPISYNRTGPQNIFSIFDIYRNGFRNVEYDFVNINGQYIDTQYGVFDRDHNLILSIVMSEDYRTFPLFLKYQDDLYNVDILKDININVPSYRFFKSENGIYISQSNNVLYRIGSLNGFVDIGKQGFSVNPLISCWDDCKTVLLQYDNSRFVNGFEGVKECDNYIDKCVDINIHIENLKKVIKVDNDTYISGDIYGGIWLFDRALGRYLVVRRGGSERTIDLTYSEKNRIFIIAMENSIEAYRYR